MNSVSDILSSKTTDDFFNTADNCEQKPVNSEQNSIDVAQIQKIPNTATLDNSQLKTMIHSMQDQLSSMLRLVSGEEVKQHAIASEGNSEMLETGERIIEGVFNGEKMIGPDGQEYSVPPNYASKSKLVEGDMMKLTITNNGRFIYKQIAPIERKRLTGELVSDPSGQWSALADGKTYKILTASVTFYKGRPGDEVVFFVPESGESSWGAVENIINK